MNKNKKKKKRYRFILLGLLLAGIGYGVVKKLIVPSTSLSVAVTTPEQKSIKTVIEAIGTVKALKEYPLYVSGEEKVSQVYVSVGDQVKKGDLLISYSTTTRETLKEQIKEDQIAVEVQEKKLSQLMAKEPQVNKQYENSVAALNRADKLFKLGAISQKDYESAENDQIEKKLAKEAIQQEQREVEYSIAQKKNILSKDERNLKETILETRSPVSGVVTSLTAQPNYVVSSQSPEPLCTISDLNSLVIQAEIGDDQSSSVQVGQNVLIKTSQGDTLTGTVSHIAAMATAPTSSQATISTVTVDISFTDSKHLLKPNYGVTVEIEIAQKESAWVVPSSAISVNAMGKPQLYLLKDNNEVVSKVVEIGVRSATEVEVSPVDSSMRVIVTLFPQIRPGITLKNKQIVQWKKTN